MYSRDVFPRYASGGMPIPPNYSGNAVRRTAAQDAPQERTRVHVPSAHKTPPAARRGRTEPPQAAAAGDAAEASPQANAEVAAEAMAAGMESVAAVPTDAAADGETAAGDAVAAGVPPAPPQAQDAPRAAIPPMLATLLPPKPTGGMLSDIGAEELLLLGLFLLLWQGEAEDDALMVLALLFLYR